MAGVSLDEGLGQWEWEWRDSSEVESSDLVTG